MADWLGFIAGAVTTVAFLPQVLRVYRLKSAREISLVFTVMFLAGLMMWLGYGVIYSLPPVIFWNAVSAVMATALLYAKLKYGR